MRRNLAMAAAAFFLFLSAAAPSPATPDGRSGRGPGEFRLLLLVCNLWGANYNLIRDVMELQGWTIRVAGVTDTVTACPWSAQLGSTPMPVDLKVDELSDLSGYDALMVMPASSGSGDSHRQLLDSPEALALVSRAVEEGLLVGAFCGGVRVLAAADVIQGRRVTGHTSYLQEYLDAGAIWAGQPVPPVVDGNILTCTRGQYYSRQVVERMAVAIDSLRAVRRAAAGR